MPCGDRDVVPGMRDRGRGGGASSGPGLLVAGDELLEARPGLLVRPLLGRGLHEVRGGGQEGALEAAVHGDLAAADRVDDDAGRVRRVPDLELELDVDRLVPETPPL